PLALVLRDILIKNKDDDMLMGDTGSAKQDMRELIKYALIVVSTAPIMLLYPFLQRFFVKGVMIGAIKG
ncbi:MAG: carbohydrate ABC transporter permease, partial [Clostridiaceae bacterium]|nr:carbohydrate ABC transporter permease [Clostridiaceae bacterium]